MLSFSILLFGFLCTAQQPVKKLLIIGIDGCRSDVIRKEFAPVMDSLLHMPTTAYSLSMKNEFHTMSAPNWTSMLNGVHCFHHRTLRNNFAHCKPVKYPHFYKYLKDAHPEYKTASLSNWVELNKCIVNGNADYAPLQEMSAHEVSEQMLHYLRLPTDSVPAASFAYYEDVDHAGHQSGFSPENPAYTSALKNIDMRVGALLQAVEARKEKYKNEDWLVIISTDHGGRKHRHVGGHAIGFMNRHIRRVFLIIHGQDAKSGKIPKARTVDVACTALRFFEVPIQKSWKLQGKPVGLK